MIDSDHEICLCGAPATHSIRGMPVCDEGCDESDDTIAEPAHWAYEEPAGLLLEDDTEAA